MSEKYGQVGELTVPLLINGQAATPGKKAKVPSSVDLNELIRKKREAKK